MSVHMPSHVSNTLCSSTVLHVRSTCVCRNYLDVDLSTQTLLNLSGCSLGGVTSSMTRDDLEVRRKSAMALCPYAAWMVLFCVSSSSFADVAMLVQPDADTLLGTQPMASTADLGQDMLGNCQDMADDCQDAWVQLRCPKTCGRAANLSPEMLLGFFNETGMVDANSHRVELPPARSIRSCVQLLSHMPAGEYFKVTQLLLLADEHRLFERDGTGIRMVDWFYCLSNNNISVIGKNEYGSVTACRVSPESESFGPPVTTSLGFFSHAELLSFMRCLLDAKQYSLDLDANRTCRVK